MPPAPRPLMSKTHSTGTAPPWPGDQPVRHRDRWCRSIPDGSSTASAMASQEFGGFGNPDVIADRQTTAAQTGNVEHAEIPVPPSDIVLIGHEGNISDDSDRPRPRD